MSKAQPPATKRLRLDIQGLRALAVALVVVFHLFPKHLPGGYIGVDIFFVISGFLITGHLLREVETTGRVKVTEFWARRIRRLIPASLLVLLVTIALTATVMPANTRPQNYGDIGFAAGYVLNWRLAANSIDYLNAAFPPTLVQHYWSLSIEEQFYLVWPLIIVVAIGIAALVKKPKRGFILGALIAVLVLSLAFSVLETARSQPSAYFLTTTRAWEFALGGLVAMVPAAKFSAASRGVLSIIAVGAIAGSAILFGAATPFPGAIALIPVAATAILIWCGDTDSAGWKFAPQRLTHNRAVQFLGDTSYSVYLWHWPLILAITAAAPAVGWGWRRALVVIPVTLALAWLTLRFVEDPIRKAPGILKRRSATFGLMVVAVGAVIGLAASQIVAIQQDVDQRRAAIESLLSGENTQSGTQQCVGAYAILNKCDNPHAYEEALIDPTFAQEDTPWLWFRTGVGKDHCTRQKVATEVERSCDFPGEGNQIMLLGDSHAEQFAAPLQQLAAEEGWGLRMESRASCELVDSRDSLSSEDAARCREWSEQQLSAIEADPTIDTVIVSIRADLVAGDVDPTPALNRLRDAGKQVIVMRDAPSVGFVGADGVRLNGAQCLIEQGPVDDACSWFVEQDPDWLTAAATAMGISVLDTHQMVCPDGTCHMISGDLVVYSDDNHFTGMYANSLKGWFARELKPLLSRSS
ncbi:acyltransferase family protein [Leucobacter viscericola]|uniref:Acyltransferase family protein n=1 Tax=Leucobacter viscericola TaxID=2714935 RepID=A0A6G7XEU9_9MICO|nr:acyltransferase family protein [Leucobacter viscericola]QIK62996.1 acyltransferase family protein [Leucobacter viscericola]